MNIRYQLFGEIKSSTPDPSNASCVAREFSSKLVDLILSLKDHAGHPCQFRFRRDRDKRSHVVCA